MPGHVDVGERSLELHPADGHTPDGMAIWVPWARVLIAGDYLSPVEIPMISRAARWRRIWRRCDRLEPLVEQADHVVPGHGGPIDGVRAAAILREDLAYLEALADVGADAPLPLARRTAAQRSIQRDERHPAMT